jgi:hypothetical protein
MKQRLRLRKKALRCRALESGSFSLVQWRACPRLSIGSRSSRPDSCADGTMLTQMSRTGGQRSIDQGTGRQQACNEPAHFGGPGRQVGWRDGAQKVRHPLQPGLVSAGVGQRKMQFAVLHRGKVRAHLVAQQRQHKAVLPVRDLLRARHSPYPGTDMALPQMVHRLLVHERKNAGCAVPHNTQPAGICALG